MMADGSAQVFPDDLVLEIVARCRTVADVIHCAATSKSIRRGILNAPFLRRLLRDGRGNGHGPFIPSVLLGLYQQTGDLHRRLAFVPAPGCAETKYPLSVVALPPNRAAEDPSACQFGPYLPVASRRSLLVLRRQCSVIEEHLTERHGLLHPVELSACSPATGERRVLPPNDLLDTSHAVLDVQPLAPSTAFKLLVAELTEQSPKTLYVQIFSSEEEDWGSVMYCPISRYCEFVSGPGRRPSPVVVGDTVNWLCYTEVGHRILSWRWRGNGGVVSQKTSLVKLPSSLVCGDVEMCLAVLPSSVKDAAVPRQVLLSLIVLERGEIQVWVHEKTGGRRFTWVLRHRIQGTEVARPMGLGDGWLCGKELACFSEGSGTLFLRDWGNNTGPLLLGQLDCNRTTSELKVRSWDLHPAAEFCPYEIDVLSYMLFVMKIF